MNTRLLTFAVVLGLALACSKDDGPQLPEPGHIEQQDPDPEPENRAPNGFVLIAPAMDLTDVVPNPTLVWEQALDPDGDPISYDLYLDNEEEPTTKIAESISDTVSSINGTMPLSLARNYFWKVTARDNKGEETSSETFKFKIKVLNDAQELKPDFSFGALSNHASVVFDDKMWILGGSFQGTAFNDIFSSDDDTWQAVVSSQKFTPRFFHSAVVFENKIWVLGGLVDGSFSNDLWHSSNGRQWNSEDQLADLVFEKRSEHTATVHNDRLWVIGGNSSEGKLADVWHFKTGEGWENTIEVAPFGKRNFHQTVSFSGKLWVIGGFDENGNSKNDVWSSVDGISWQEETPNAPFSPRGFHKSLVFDDKIWVIGSGSKNDIWYSEDGINWTDATPDISFPVSNGFTALFYDHKIRILGGNDTDDIWNIAYPDF